MTTLTQQEEEKNKRIALIVSIVVHVLLALFLFYMIAWDAPDPTLDELGGIEISYGTSDLGSGDVNSQAEPNDSESPEDSKPAATAPVTTPTPTPQPQQQVTSPPQAERVVTTTQDAPVSVKEEVKPQPTPQPKPEPKEEKKVDTRALFPGKSTSGSGNGKAGTSNKPTGNNNGDADGTVGDKGNPLGKYPGKKNGAGGSGGGSLNMPGWRYDLEPRRDPYDNETGKIVFRVRIDSNGEIESVQVVESNVSPQVVQWYRNEISKTSFSRTNNQGASQGATGTITFILKSN